MFEKNMRFAFLLDFYSEILDEHTRDILKAYYEDDLSLAEIAEDECISRQGVRHIIKKGEDELDFFEEKLSLAKQSELSDDIAAKLDEVIENLKKRDDPSLDDELLLLKEIKESLANK